MKAGWQGKRENRSTLRFLASDLSCMPYSLGVLPPSLFLTSCKRNFRKHVFPCSSRPILCYVLYWTSMITSVFTPFSLSTAYHLYFFTNTYGPICPFFQTPALTILCSFLTSSSFMPSPFSFLLFDLSFLPHSLIDNTAYLYISSAAKRSLSCRSASCWRH